MVEFNYRVLERNAQREDMTVSQYLAHEEITYREGRRGPTQPGLLAKAVALGATHHLPDIAGLRMSIDGQSRTPASRLIASHLIKLAGGGA